MSSFVFQAGTSGGQGPLMRGGCTKGTDALPPWVQLLYGSHLVAVAAAGISDSPITDTEALGVGESASLTVQGTAPETSMLAETASVVLLSVGTEASTVAEGAALTVPASVIETATVGESPVAALGAQAITDSDVLAITETVQEPSPPVVAAAPPVFGGGLGRKREPQPTKVRRLARRVVQRDQVSLNEMAVVDVYWIARPWSLEVEEEEVLVTMLLLA